MSNVPVPDPLVQLRARARVLHRKVAAGDTELLAWLERLQPGLDVSAIQRRHCLAAVARDLGFGGWSHLVGIVSAEASLDTPSGAQSDFGTLLCPPGSAAYWNVWSAHYAEAREIRDAHGGYLLGYRNQFLIVDEHFVEYLGLDPDDPDWNSMARDWVRPQDRAARTRLYGKLFELRRTQGPVQ